MVYRQQPDILTNCSAASSNDPQIKTQQQLRSNLVRSIISEYQLDETHEALFRDLEPKLRLTKLVNAVSPVFTGVKLDLSLVQEKAKALGLKYSKSSGFVGISVRLADPEYSCSYTAIFFSSGSINCVGLSSDSPEYLVECTNLLKKYCNLFFGPQLADKLQWIRKVTNRVFTIHLKQYTLELQEMKHLASWRSSRYVSEAFPGAIRSFDNNPATKKTRLLLFKTGKLIFTGIKNHLTRFQVENQLLKFFGEIVAYKMNNPLSRIISRKSGYEIY